MSFLEFDLSDGVIEREGGEEVGMEAGSFGRGEKKKSK